MPVETALGVGHVETMACSWLAGCDLDVIPPLEWYAQSAVNYGGGVFVLGPRGRVYQMAPRGSCFTLPERESFWSMRK
jgi:hypothetical protein